MSGIKAFGVFCGIINENWIYGRYVNDDLRKNSENTFKCIEQSKIKINFSKTEPADPSSPLP